MEAVKAPPTTRVELDARSRRKRVYGFERARPGEKSPAADEIHAAIGKLKDARRATKVAIAEKLYARPSEPEYRRMFGVGGSAEHDVAASQLTIGALERSLGDEYRFIHDTANHQTGVLHRRE